MESKCPCPLCTRNRVYHTHLNSIESEEARKFFTSLYDRLNFIEEELDVTNIYLKNLKNLYPKVHKEVCTIRELSPEDSNFPETFI